MAGEFDLMDVTDDELRKLGEVQALVSSRYIGKPKDIKVFAALKDELEERCREIGFEVRVVPEASPQGNWVPVCNIIGRTEHVDFDPERIVFGRKGVS